jgi:drug/metabolite transporter (DMT)-like permease
MMGADGGRLPLVGRPRVPEVSSISIGLALALVAATAVAVAHVLAKDVLGELPIGQFYVVRTGGGVVATFIALVAMGDLPPLLNLQPSELALLFGAGLLVPFAVNLFSFWSMKRMPLNVHAPLLRSYVVFVFIISLIFLDEGLSFLAGAAVLITFAGVAAFSAARQAQDQQKASPAAMLMCLASALLLATGVIVWKLLRSFATPAMIAFTGCVTTEVLFLIGYAIRRPRSGPLPALIKAVISGALVFGVGNFCWIAALGYSSSPVVSAVHSTSTLIIAVLAYIFLRERWTRGQAAAAISICAGVILLFFG